MKKLFSIAAALLLVFGLVGCGSKDQGTTGGDATDKKVVNVGVSIYKFDDNFMTLYRNAIVEQFAAQNTDTVEYNVVVQDGKNDMAEQTNQVDNFISQGYDVLVINLVNSSSASTIIDKCESAGVPCVFINREPSEDDMTKYAGHITYVGADARQSGRMQGELIADLENKGDLNGDGKLQYVMVVGDPENVDAQYRTQFSIEQYLDKSGLEVDKIDEQRGDWDQNKGQEIVANALASGRGSEIEVVFCNNDAMALGAYQAIQAAGRTVGEDIYLVGVDALADAVDLITAGNMTGTVLNDHNGQAKTAVEAAIKAVNGETLDAYYWVDYVKVTPENAASFK